MGISPTTMQMTINATTGRGRTENTRRSRSQRADNPDITITSSVSLKGRPKKERARVAPRPFAYSYFTSQVISTVHGICFSENTRGIISVRLLASAAMGSNSR